MHAHAQRTESFERVPTVVRRRRLVDDHGDLVRIVARQVAARHDLGRCSLDEDDLFSVGILGLFDSENRFDPTSGCPFRTFAEFRIKGAMLDEIRRRDTMPRRLRAANIKLSRAAEAIQRRTGRRATAEELAEATAMTVDRVHTVQLRANAHRPASPEQMASRAASPFDVVATKQRYEHLIAAIECLPEREQLVLDLYFHREMTLREIAEILDVSEGRVCQIKGEAIQCLRTEFNDE
jgi:RNA polymerase sigma factor for flagellar operon FliA